LFEGKRKKKGAILQATMQMMGCIERAQDTEQTKDSTHKTVFPQNTPTFCSTSRLEISLALTN
jgi:hypothetical protein